jgi:hypothetical protein
MKRKLAHKENLISQLFVEMFVTWTLLKSGLSLAKIIIAAILKALSWLRNTWAIDPISKRPAWGADEIPGTNGIIRK